MAKADADRNLLFGLLALQTGLINQAALLVAFHAWTQAKNRRLAEILVEQGALDGDGQELILALADKHLKLHSGDPERSLAALPAGRSTREELARLADPEIDASLMRLGSGPSEASDFDRTASYSVGTATSEGQRFRILRPHARGGLGAVFVALDAELNREVALKQILDHHADDPTSRARFLTEAEITGGLEHPGIVPVYGLGTYANGRPFYAMRLIRGESLKSAIEHFHGEPGRVSAGSKSKAKTRGADASPPAFRQLLRRFIDVCNAMEYAHSRGILHRDLKPANVILGKHGETLIVDWGLAKPVGRREPGGPSDERTLIPSSASGSAETLPGSALGTPAYMSPEQAAGALDRLGPWTDVYSLGATLFGLLTGQPPFQGDDVGAVLQAVQKGAFPPPRRLDSLVAPALEAICLKAMALLPEDRYASPRALADDVERWMADEPVAARRDPVWERARRWMRGHRPVVAAASALLVTAVVALGAGTLLLRAANGQIREQRDEARKQRELAQSGFRQARQAVDDYFTRISENTLLNSPVPGMQPLRKELLETALRYYRAFQAQAHDDPALRAELARAIDRVGRINESIGTNEETLAAYEEALALFEAMVRDRPADLTLRQDLARVNRSVGSVLSKRMGRPVEGLERLRNAVALSESLVREEPGRPEFEEELGTCLSDLGYELRLPADAAGALASLQQALAIWDRLARGEPRYRLQQALTLGRVGVCHANAGSAVEAQASLDRARELLEQLSREAPGDIAVARELAQVWRAIGHVHRTVTHRTERSMNAFRQSGQIWDRLARENPAVAEFRWHRMKASQLLGEALTEAGRSAEAVNVLQGAIAEGERMLATAPTEAAGRSDLASALIALAKAFSRQGRAADAIAPLTAARTHLEALRNADRGNTSYLGQQARCMRFLAAALDSLRRDDEAIRVLSEAIQILVETSEEARRLDNFIISALGVYYGELGELQQKTGRLADAQRTLEKADALGTKYTGEAGSPRLDPVWLADSRIRLGLVRMELGQREKASEALLRAEADLRAQPALDPGAIPSLAAVDSALAELAGTDAEKKAYDGKAADAFRSAVAAAEPDALRELATAPAFRRLRLRPDTGALLFDRIFPDNPFAPAD
jgi:serine/threonine-protein kinase